MSSGKPRGGTFKDHRVEITLHVDRHTLLIRPRGIVTQLRHDPEVTLSLGQGTGFGIGSVAEKSTGLHVAHGSTHCRTNGVQIRIGVGGRKEQRPPFPDVDATIDQVMAEDVHLKRLIQVTEVAREVEPHQRSVVDEVERHTFPVEDFVHGRHEPPCAFVESGLQRRSLTFEFRQHRARSGHRERMFAERAGVERTFHSRVRVVSIPPRTTIDAIQERTPRGHDPERHAAADHLAVGGDVRLHTEVHLRAAGVDAEACDHLVENERHVVAACDLTHLAEEFRRVQTGPTALHGFHKHGRQCRRLRLNHLKGLVQTVGQHDRIANRRRGHTRRHGHRLLTFARRPGQCQRGIGMSVIRAGERHDALAPGGGTHHSQRRHHRLGARVAEGDALHTRQLTNQARHFGRMT